MTSPSLLAESSALMLPCQLHDPDLWFADAPAELECAKALCAECPLRLACLAGALERREFAGVWGGEIFDEGSIVSHKRGRGRPRKDSTPPRRYSSPNVEALIAGADEAGSRAA